VLFKEYHHLREFTNTILLIMIINTAIPKGSGIRCEIIIPDTDERLEILNNVREKHEEQT